VDLIQVTPLHFINISIQTPHATTSPRPSPQVVYSFLETQRDFFNNFLLLGSSFRSSGAQDWRCTRILIKLMRGGKGQGRKAKLAATEMSNLEPMVWTRERAACDLIGHK
jgi:hypothetical protein